MSTPRPRRDLIWTNEPWTADALCTEADPDLWYPIKGASYAAARAMCAVCPVQDECLNYALTNRERYGIWAGTSYRQRVQLNKARAAA